MFCHTSPKNFAKWQKNWSTSKNDTKRRKLFRKRNHFSSKYFSGSAISCCKNREKIFFLTKGPTFFISKSEGGWNILHFFKKILSSKPSKGTSVAVLITMPVIFRWEFKKSSPRILKKKNGKFFSFEVSFSLVCSSRYFLQFCQTWNYFFAVVKENSSTIRKNWID